MAQAHPLSKVGSRVSFFAVFHSLAAAHTSNIQNHNLVFPSSRGSGKHIVFPVAIVPAFGTSVITRRTTLTTVTMVSTQLISTQVTNTWTKVEDFSYNGGCG